VYDASKEKTFEGASKWIKDIEFDANPNVIIMLVANKIDLAD
jgi:GTPase SAR1 family protein